jgi:hypothetical protein
MIILKHYEYGSVEDMIYGMSSLLSQVLDWGETVYEIAKYLCFGISEMHGKGIVQ